MGEYIQLKDYAKHMGICKGDIVFITSDARVMMWDAMQNKCKPDLNMFIDGLIEVVGEDGTIIFPTYNWGFCDGKIFDYNKTPCLTGACGTVALARKDFKRTKHPIYSFAVWGKYQELLCDMVNVDSFGKDSPFVFFHKHNVKNYIFDVSLMNSFTFAHYAEQQSGLVDYRYVKEFSSVYIDETGAESRRTYSMFVRKLELDVQTTIDPIEEDFIRQGAQKNLVINNSKVKCIYLAKAYEIMINDIRNNRARKLCNYKGQ